LIQRFKENRMRKFIVGTLLFAGAGGGVVLSGAAMSFASGPTTQCNTPLPSTPLGQTSVLAPSGASTSGELQVCESNSPIVNGTATAEGSGGPNGVTGYVVANGDPGSNATGYIGAEGTVSPSTQSANVVGCSSGDYNNGTNSNTDGTGGTSAPGPNDGTGTTDANGNNVIVGTSGNSLAQTATGTCSVTNEPQPAVP
jgi:hypothetical protein